MIGNNVGNQLKCLEHPVLPLAVFPRNQNGVFPTAVSFLEIEKAHGVRKRRGSVIMLFLAKTDVWAGALS